MTMFAQASAYGDPLFQGEINAAIVRITHHQGRRRVRDPARRGDALHLVERKVIADMQNRIGPNRAGPFGVLQTLADGIKLFFKEQSIPDAADRLVFRLAPYLSIMPAFLMFASSRSAATSRRHDASRSSATRRTCRSPTCRSASLFILAMSVDRACTA